MTDDFEASEKVRHETVEFIAQSLGVKEVYGITRKDFVPENRIVASFEYIGSALRRAYNLGMYTLAFNLTSDPNIY